MHKIHHSASILQILCAILLAGCARAANATSTPIPTHTSAATDRPAQVQLLTPAPTSTPVTTATPIYIPQPPPLISPPPASTMTDVLTTSLADERRANGDSYTRNIYERPYTAEDMDYIDYLDIGRVISIGISGEWVFVSIPLAGVPPASDQAYYAVELDLNIDGRGDWLFYAPSPDSSEWAQEGLMILIDSNVDVGGISPSAPDEPSSQADGFDARVFNQGEGLDPDAAWVRRDPENPATIQFAFKHGLIANDRRFLWRVIASGSEIDPHLFELNDHFSLEEAGSPLLTSPHYPIKAIALIDSSCRWSYGFTPLGTEPGICGGSN